MDSFIKKYILFFFLILWVGLSGAESQESKGNTHRATIQNGDTLPYIELPTVSFYAPRVFANRFEEAKYLRLVRNVKRVYPYARLAGIKFEEYSEMLAQIDTDAERRRKTKVIEEDLKAEFEGELRRLTISQGHILIKLIDRETKHTSYDVLKDFRGNFTAIFWQSFGRIFGYNLKTEYDPNGEDKLIEEIILLIDQGAI